jgi:hypothetical protein
MVFDTVRVRKVKPDVSQHIFAMDWHYIPTMPTLEQMGIASVSYPVVGVERFSLPYRDNRERRRKQIARRQKRAAFRRKMRGLA